MKPVLLKPPASSLTKLSKPGKEPPMKPGGLVLETGEVFKGFFIGEEAQAGELVFNTSHTGYEEMATDPSYYNQILIMTAPLQGNYGASKAVWESDRLWIKGFVCMEMQNSLRDKEWPARLSSQKIPILSAVDTRSLTLRLRREGVVWGALAPLSKDSFKQTLSLIKREKSKAQGKDWTQFVCVLSPKEFQGRKRKGLKLALMDFGYKKNILRELLKRSEKVCVFPSHSSFSDVRSWNPDAVVLSNGPGDPKDVLNGVRLVEKFLSWKPIFGICMGHQVLAQALGAETYKLKFGHRGSNHPIQDRIFNRIYISAQNHGYAVRESSLPQNVQVSHTNLNDKTVAGIYSEELRCLGVQFHPEHSPGPREALSLFDFFINKMVKGTPGAGTKKKRSEAPAYTEAEEGKSKRKRSEAPADMEAEGGRPKKERSEAPSQTEAKGVKPKKKALNKQKSHPSKRRAGHAD